MLHVLRRDQFSAGITRRIPTRATSARSRAIQRQLRLRQGISRSSQTLIKGGVEVPDRALMPSKLHELVGAGVQPALHTCRHLVVLHQAARDEATLTCWVDRSSIW